MSKRRVSREVLAAQARLALEFEPLWKPAWCIRGRRMLEQREAVQAEAKRAALAWLSRKVGRTIDDFAAVTDYTLLLKCAEAVAGATILDVERAPDFASTPYGASMIAHWKKRWADWKAEFGHLLAFRQAQQAKRNYRPPPPDPERQAFIELMRDDVADWRKP